MLNELQNAAAGWRRVLAVLDTPADVADPGDDGEDLPRGPISVRFEHVWFAYPGGPDVLRDVDLELAAAGAGRRRRRDGLGQDHVRQAPDPADGPQPRPGAVDGVDLRRRALLVAARTGGPGAAGRLPRSTTPCARTSPGAATTRPGLRGARTTPHTDEAASRPSSAWLDWVEQLPHGLDTQVGQRGESLSAGERQLVALARAYLADPDLLVLDEATSAVDPATEVRLARALDGAHPRARTSVAIAHRLSTAEAADLVVVVDAGESSSVGPHARAAARPRPSTPRLHASWVGPAAAQPPGLVGRPGT